MAFGGNHGWAPPPFGFPFGPPDPRLPALHAALQSMKNDAEKALQSNQLLTSLDLYTQALDLAQHIVPFGQEEIPKLLCNRSLVLTKLLKYPEALANAQQCIQLFPNWIKGYWRAAQAFKGMTKHYEALRCLIDGVNICCMEDEDVIYFWAEIVATICLIVDDPLNLLEDVYVPDTDKHIIKVLLRLGRDNCWEGVSLMVIGIHNGPISDFDEIASCCSMQSMSVGALLTNVKPKEMKKWGMKLAITMLKNGAMYEDIEFKMGRPAILIGVQVALDTGLVDLLKHMLATYVKTQDRKNAKDKTGNTGFHLLVKSGKVNTQLGETILNLLKNNDCNPTLKDDAGKSPIQYLSNKDIAYTVLSSAEKTAGEKLQKEMNMLKEEGNIAYREQRHEKAIEYYSKALNLIDSGDQFYQKEASVLYSNRSMAYSGLDKYDQALEDAVESVRCDPTRHKGHWRRGQVLRCMGQHREAYSAFLEGFHKSQNVNQDVKCNFLVEAAVSFSCISAEILRDQSYRGLQGVPGILWPSVLGKLSRAGDWTAMRYLVLGTEKIPCGVAATVDCSDVMFSTLFSYLRQKSSDAHKWLTKLVVTLLENGALLLNFVEDDNDTPVHAAVKYSLLTGNTKILDDMPDFSGARDIIDKHGDSPFHVITKRRPTSNLKSMVLVANVLIQKQFSPDIQDRNKMLAVEYINPHQHKQLYDLLIKVTKPPSMKIPSSKSQPINKPSVHPSGNLSDKELKDRGNAEFSKGNMTVAAQLYTQAIDASLRSDKGGHDMAVLYGNRAECYLKLGLNAKAFDDAIESVSHDGHWYKGHLRVGRAQNAMCRYELAAKALGNAFNALDNSALENIRLEILAEFVSVYIKLDQVKYHPAKKISILTCPRGELWARASYDLVCKNQWSPAECAYLQFRANDASVVTIKLDLQPLCKLDKVDSSSWILDLIKYFIVCGSDHKAVSVQNGDKYIHAVIRLTLAAGDLDFLLYMLNEIVVPAGDQNLLDNKGNTALHVATRDPRAIPLLRLRVIAMLLDIAVNPLTKNKEGRLAIEYLPKNEGHAGDIILQYMQMQDELDKGMKQQKKQEEKKKEQLRQKQEQQKRQEEQRQQNEQRRRQEEQKRQQEQQKRQQEKERQQKKREEKQSSRGFYGQSQNTAQTHNSYDQCQRCEKVYLECAENLQNESKKIKFVYSDLAQILKMKHRGDKHIEIQNKIITLIVKSMGSTLNPEIPEKLAKISDKLYRSIVDGLAENEKWRQMDTAVQEYRRHHGDMALRDFAKKLNIPKVIRHSTFKGSESLLVQIIENMLDSGGMLEKDGKLAVLAAIQEEQFKVLAVILRRGASPEHLTLNIGDTPVHAALSIALERDRGNFTILNMFLDTYEKDPKSNSMLDPQQQDANGDGLFHVVARIKYNSTAQKATELLCDRKVSAAILNNDGKLPYHYLSKNDRRLQFFRLASVGGDPKPIAQKKNKSKSTNRASPQTILKEEISQNASAEICESMEDLLQYERTDETKSVQVQDVSVKKERTKMASRKDAVKRRIEEMIFELPEVPYSIFAPKKQRIEEGTKSTREEEDVKETDQENATKNKTKCEEIQKAEEVDAEETVREEQTESDNNDEEEEEDEKVDGHFELDVQVFDNLEWEVECTAEVWKTLRDKKVVPELKHRVVRKIQLLASGEWRPHLCKKVIHDIPDSLKLYEAKLSKGSRIIWELAVAFSPRLSETADRRLQTQEYEMDKQPVKGGRMYSEVIRVWDITFDHDKIYRTVQRIVKSHNRGESCIIQKKLKGIKQTQFQAGAKKRLPMLYAETDIEMDKEKLKEYQQELQQYFPPASANETEYHILKFYSFSSNLVSHILQNIEMKVDFPFRVTDLEHAIINLQSQAPILLLGRSGTGKTTCCLYRLWSQFLSYWSKAQEAEAPLLPRCIQFIPQDIKTGEDSEEEDEEENEEFTDENDSDVNNNNQNEAAAASSTNQCLDVGDDSENEDLEGATEGGQIYDHLHQVFITKNGVLCTEVQKNFRELSHACDIAVNQVNLENQALPNRLQNAVDFQFPLFVTSRQLLLMLDASLEPPYFFDRNEDGSLKVDIQGWSDDGPLSFLPLLNEDSDDEDDEEHGQFDDADDDDDATVIDAPVVSRKKQKVDPRREVTYDIFAEEVWPRISKKFCNKYHPSLIWTEIMSFIKGSFEALSKPTGYLTKEEYKDLGRKRAPNFASERDNIYNIFRRYLHYKTQRFLFDETDLVFQVYSRLKTMVSLTWIVHQVFVDETQDFTQAELCLLMRICQNPNQMFLTGDTAQSIMRGIAFRFSDLRSLFFYASQSMQAVGKTSAIEVPKQVYQLTHNYRSHAGILSLASSILDLMVEFFPESFDRLEKDQGLFEGPAPVLLESCSFSDLAMLLRGNKRKTSHIEFGAHQAILVVNNAARDNIPEELRLGLILTIYEAKGLEFDDVLLYNFFKDSQASKEWRVVTDFLEKLAVSNISSTQQESLVGLDEDILQLSGRPRPLTFDPNQHKVLNSELKHLYTAVTRARVNVWIFDEDMDKRAPMFEYFKARKLVRVLTNTDSNQDMATEGMFAEESTSEDWIRRGDDFMKHNLYEVAAKCYSRGGDEQREKVASAHQQALIASRIRDNPQRMREEFLNAAEKYLECQMPSKAAICLQNAREREFVAHIYEKLGQLDRAGETYRKLKKPVEASSCYERLGKFNQAVEILRENELYDLAIDTLRRYKMLIQDLKSQRKEVPQVLSENPPSKMHTEERLSYKSAEVYHTYKNESKMMAALDRLPKLEDRLDFLKRKGYFLQASKVLQREGRYDEAASLLLRHGKTREAVELARQSNNKDMIARCLIVDATVKLYGCKDEDDVNTQVVTEAVTQTIKEAVELIQNSDNKDLIGDAYLFLGQLTGEEEHINKAWGMYNRAASFRNETGQLECMDWMVENANKTSHKTCVQLVLGMENLLKVVRVVNKQTTEHEKLRAERIFSFYGLKKKNEDVYYLYPQQSPRAVDILKRILSEVNKRSTQCELPKDRVAIAISRFLLERGLGWYQEVNTAVNSLRKSFAHCVSYTVGKPCETEDCIMMHVEHTKESYSDLLAVDMLMIELDYYIQSNCCRLDADTSQDILDLVNQYVPEAMHEKYFTCKQLILDLIPKHIQPKVLSDIIQWFHRNISHKKFVKMQLTDYLKCKYDRMKDEKSGERKYNVDVFVQLVFLSYLLKLGFNIEAIMSEFESDVGKEFSERFNDDRIRKKVENLGFMCSYHTDDHTCESKLIVQCVPRRFWDAFVYLSTMHNDPMESLIKFTKFLALLGRSNQAELLPELEHFSLWLEVYTTIGLCMAAKLYSFHDFFFVMPESYKKTLNFIDSSFTDGIPTLEAIARYRPHRNTNINLVHDRLEKLLGILYGNREKGQKLNLLSLVFESPSAIDSGIAERLVVLSITLLCNMGYAVMAKSEAHLLHALCRCNSVENLPPRLATALKNISSSKGICDLVCVLRDFLEERGDNLLFCRWDSTKRYGICSELLHKVSYFQTSFYNDETLTVLMSPHVAVTPLVTDEETNVQDDDCKLTMEETIKRSKEQDERQNKENQKLKADIIIRFLRMACLRKKCERLSKLVKQQIEKERAEKQKKLFENVIVDDSMCGICGVTFESQKSDLVASPEHDNQSGNPESPVYMQTNLSPQQIDKNPFASLLSGFKSVLSFGHAESSELSLRQMHEQSQSHIQKKLEFSSFKKRYMEEIVPPLQEITAYIAHYRLDTDTANQYFPAMPLDIQKLLNYKVMIEQDTDRIVHQKNWIDHQKLLETAKEAQIPQELREYIHQQYVAIQENKRSAKAKSAIASGSKSKMAAVEDDVDDEAHRIEHVVDEPSLRKSHEFRPSKSRGRARGKAKKKDD